MDIIQKRAHTCSLLHSVSQPTSQPHCEQTKRTNILHEDSTLPGDGASYPCIALGGSEEVGASGLGGFVSAEEYTHTHMQTRAQNTHASMHFVALLADKAIIPHQSIRAADSCVLVVFSLCVTRVFPSADWWLNTDGRRSTFLL